MYEKLLENCTLCPRECKVNRLEGMRGYCGMDSRIRAARAALHMWEEPCISGKKGSGAVFFSGCGLRCCFCQNRNIAIGDSGKEITVQRLADIFSGAGAKGGGESESGDRCSLCTADYFRPGNRQKRGIDAAGSV